MRLDDLRRLIELPVLDVDPADPVAAGEDRAGRVEGEDGKRLLFRERADCRVGGEAFLPTVRVIADQAAQESGDVGGRRVDLHRAEVDQSGDGVAVEQHVVVPDVADAGLERQRDVGERGEAGDGDAGRRAASSATNSRASGARSGHVVSVIARVSDSMPPDCNSRRRVRRCVIGGRTARRRRQRRRAREVGDRNVELGEGRHRGAEFFDARELFVVGDAGEPGGEFPEVSGVVEKCHAGRSLQSARAESSCRRSAACLRTAWMNCSPSGVGCSIGQHRSTSVPRGATIRQNRAPLRPPAEPSGSTAVGRQSGG